MTSLAHRAFLLFLACSLVTASQYKPLRQCEAGLCQCGSYCRAIEGEQTCCPSKDGYPEHICGPNRECCGVGCCREGWQCGPYDLCYQPDTWTSSLRPDHTSTIITVVRPNPEHPTTDRDISGSLPTVSSHGTGIITISVSETLPVSLAPTSQDEAGHTVPIAVTQPNGQATTLLSTVQEGATSSHLPVVSGPDPLESTSESQPSTPSIPVISTVFTRPDGEVSTAVPSTETGSETSKANPNPNQQSSVGSPGSETDSTRFTGTTLPSLTGPESSQLFTGTTVIESNAPESASPPASTDASITGLDTSSNDTSGDEASSTIPTGPGTTRAENSEEANPATETVVPEPSGVSTTSVVSSSRSANLSTDNLKTTPITRDIKSPAFTTNSNGPDISTISPSTEHNTSSRDETSRLESDTDAATGSGTTNTDPLLLPTSVPETQVNGVTSAVSVKPTTPLGDHSTRADDTPSTEPGHITTSDGDDEQPSSTSTYFAVPVTTSVTKPEPRDGGFVVPCNMWFFNACVGPISGWGVLLPPGTYPPGPPPAISDNPKGGIEINTNQPLPDWPGFTVGPGNTPTFSGEPTACETDSAELCVTSTSYGVSIDATVTSTVVSGVVSTCGTVYGCKVRGHSQTITGTDVTTATSGIPTYRSLRAMETWDDMELNQGQLESIANHVQSDLDSMFGTATKRATTTTGYASEPTESVWTGTCPAKNGPDPTVVDGKFTQDIGEKCLCEWNTWMKNDKTLQPYTVDQLRDAINDFCNGSRKLRKPAPTGFPDIAVNRFPTDGTNGIFISAGWATPPLWNSTDERCKAKSDLLLADSCKAALERFECRGANRDDLWGGTYYQALDEGGCVKWTLTPAHLPDGGSAKRRMSVEM
ncbi:hypothetical protein FPHYL_7866 [Fusarium phyllophilum]|uniref:Uncharacterized protein n=1 Tax=Fusarium phyllophilum TaxID=47803 RepID=A0A8H5JMP8_9HYPO|nr:hypothetical protein FPHYL_7866 [Fusarium phyllophilum]